MQFIITLTFLTLLCVAMANKEECKKISNCKCQHSKGTVDLSSISSKLFTATKDSQTFRYFPCSQSQDVSASCKRSDDNAICMQDKSSGQVLDWGSEDSVTFLVPNTVDYGVVIAEFTSFDSKRKTELYLDCPEGNKNRAEGLEVLEVQGDNAELRLTSKAACYTPNSPTPHTTPTKPHTAPTKPHTTGTEPHTTGTPPILQIDLKKWGHWYAFAGSVGLFLVLFFFYFVVRLVLRFRDEEKHDTPKESCCYLIGLFFDGILCVFSCFPICRNSIGRRTRDYEAVRTEEGLVNDLNNTNYYSINNNNNNNNRGKPVKSCCVIL